jgi:hypothetical protein
MSMYRPLRWLLPLLILLSAHPALAKPAMPTTDVTARLVKIPGKFPPDDLYDYAYVMQFQVEGGPLDKQLILVAHYKPRRPRPEIDDAMKKNVGGQLKRFETGALVRMTLTENLRAAWKGAVIDEFFATDRKSTRYFCLKADPVEN